MFRKSKQKVPPPPPTRYRKFDLDESFETTGSNQNGQVTSLSMRSMAEENSEIKIPRYGRNIHSKNSDSMGSTKLRPHRDLNWIIPLKAVQLINQL